MPVKAPPADPVGGAPVFQAKPFWAVDEAVKTWPSVPTPSNAQPALDEPTIRPPVEVANPWIVCSLGETLKVIVWEEVEIEKKLALAVEVESKTEPEIPATVVVLLKLGAVFVIVTFPVAPDSEMPVPATAD